MSLYSISLFLHITGALALFGVLSLEWASLSGLRRATTTSQVGEWAGLQRAARLAGVAAATILITGIYLSATRWGAPAWVIVGFAAMATMAILGPALGRRRPCRNVRRRRTGCSFMRRAA